jgi:hypothetical protein
MSGGASDVSSRISRTAVCRGDGSEGSTEPEMGAYLCLGTWEQQVQYGMVGA